MAASDPRRTDLHVSARTFLAEHGLHPDPDTYLAHGYVDLCLEAWRGCTGAPLALATQWALWTWLTDDVLDNELRDADTHIVRALVGRLVDVLDGDPAEDVDQPITRALADLVHRTQPAVEQGWWERYVSEVDAWLRAAADKLEGWLRPSRTPSLRQYLLLRPVDGGMLLAAMWCELALDCVTPDWNGLLVHRLLEAFSAVGTLTNDLASSPADTFTAQAALARTTGTTELAARRHVREQLDAEQARFQFLLTAIRDDAHLDDPGSVSPVTAEFARTLDQFQRALTAWTHTSSRYALAAPAVTE